MKFPSAVTAAGNAIRKLHRQSDQTEIIVCGEFIIHVKHDYALHRAETLVSVSPTGMRTGAKCATQSSLKKLADTKLNATSSCLRTVSRARAHFTARCVRYALLLRITLSLFDSLFFLSLFQFCIILKFLAPRVRASQKRRDTTREDLLRHGRE